MEPTDFFDLDSLFCRWINYNDYDLEDDRIRVIDIGPKYLDHATSYSLGFYFDFLSMRLSVSEILYPLFTMKINSIPFESMEQLFRGCDDRTLVFHSLEGLSTVPALTKFAKIPQWSSKVKKMAQKKVLQQIGSAGQFSCMDLSHPSLRQTLCRGGGDHPLPAGMMTTHRQPHGNNEITTSPHPVSPADACSVVTQEKIIGSNKIVLIKHSPAAAAGQDSNDGQIINRHVHMKLSDSWPEHYKETKDPEFLMAADYATCELSNVFYGIEGSVFSKTVMSRTLYKTNGLEHCLWEKGDASSPDHYWRCHVASRLPTTA
eukprot:CAMPEP_0202456124 /NCGR_PEP_ID=MMETSP1360-20130828/13460_1 /ASSEMBLY_ACC=CAM_ASM_000848 /TAXON_ID=515479 /ORGANISM="Licmophora paradoxa, Strain CCMP2313" /LENGTH=316 /DNA_ID=CAMNT_0049075849 /DNA_START=18 /DNA_END=968 /DNA_ORIENTATION=-